MKFFKLFRLISISVVVSMLLTSGASAATGDLLATVTLPVHTTTQVNGTFDGTNYLYNEDFGPLVIATPPPGNGAAVLVSIKPYIDGATGATVPIIAISWDASRGLLWGSDYYFSSTDLVVRHQWRERSGDFSVRYCPGRLTPGGRAGLGCK